MMPLFHRLLDWLPRGLETPPALPPGTEDHLRRRRTLRRVARRLRELGVLFP